MPNWCINTLIIKGDKSHLKAFKRRAKSKGTDLSLECFLPMPRELVGTVSPGDNPNWYDWSLENWGTKWDIKAKLSQQFEDGLVYEFRSAWTPPVAWLKTVANTYPKLEFTLKYDEEGVGFLGVAQTIKGRVKDKSIDY